MKKKITKDTTLGEILELPGAGEILMEHKVPCLACPFASMEMQYLKIGDIAKMYGVRLNDLLKALNNLNKKNKEK